MQTQKEFKEAYLSSIDVSAVTNHNRIHIRNNNSYPTWLDWRIKGFVTEVSQN